VHKYHQGANFSVQKLENLVTLGREFEAISRLDRLESNIRKQVLAADSSSRPLPTPTAKRAVEGEWLKGLNELQRKAVMVSPRVDRATRENFEEDVNLKTYSLSI
jgi:hypothetical protein